MASQAELIRLERTDDRQKPKGNRHEYSLRVLRAILLVTSIYAMLVWIYIVMRIVVNNIDMSDLFIEGVPYFRFWITAIWMFAISFISLVLFLVIRDPSRPLVNVQYDINEEKMNSLVVRIREHQSNGLNDSNTRRFEVTQNQVASLLNISDLPDYQGDDIESNGSIVPAMEVTNRQGMPVIIVVPKQVKNNRARHSLEEYVILLVDDKKALQEEIEMAKNERSKSK